MTRRVRSVCMGPLHGGQPFHGGQCSTAHSLRVQLTSCQFPVVSRPGAMGANHQLLTSTDQKDRLCRCVADFESRVQNRSYFGKSSLDTGETSPKNPSLTLCPQSMRRRLKMRTHRVCFAWVLHGFLHGFWAVQRAWTECSSVHSLSCVIVWQLSASSQAPQLRQI